MVLGSFTIKFILTVQCTILVLSPLAFNIEVVLLTQYKRLRRQKTWPYTEFSIAAQLMQVKLLTCCLGREVWDRLIGKPSRQVSRCHSSYKHHADSDLVEVGWIAQVVLIILICCALVVVQPLRNDVLVLLRLIEAYQGRTLRGALSSCLGKGSTSNGSLLVHSVSPVVSDPLWN